MASKPPKGGIGPTFTPNDGLPPNPSDAIIQGKPLPIIPAHLSVSRPFNPILVTKNPLHYNDGPGTDEMVTSRRTGLMSMFDSEEHHDNNERTGEDKTKPNYKSDPSRTLNGVEIRGT